MSAISFTRIPESEFVRSREDALSGMGVPGFLHLKAERSSVSQIIRE
jgi:hypothetical protein